jgi:hypothetical protein
MALHHTTCLEDVPISYVQSLLKGIIGQTLFNGIIGLGAHYGDAFLILILVNQVFPKHSLKYLWIYICLHTITRHKGNSSIHQSCHFGRFSGKLRPKDVRQTRPDVCSSDCMSTIGVRRQTTTPPSGRPWRMAWLMPIPTAGCPLRPMVGLRTAAPSGGRGGITAPRPADCHPDRRTEQLFALQPSVRAGDQRLEWPSAMPSAKADCRVEWRMACRPPDVRGGPWTSEASASASIGCLDAGQP